MNAARTAAENLHFKEAMIAAIKLARDHLESIIDEYKDYLPKGVTLEEGAYDEYEEAKELIADYMSDLQADLIHDANNRIEQAYDAGATEDLVSQHYGFVDNELQNERDAITEREMFSLFEKETA